MRDSRLPITLRTLITAIVMSLAIGALYIIMIGEPRTIDGQEGGDFLRNILLDFQTLITGLLALSAAWWTVETMHQTDERAQWRHQQTVNLALRADKLRIERAVTPQLAELRQVLNDAIEFSSQMGSPAFSLGKTEFTRLSRIYSQLKDILGREQFRAAEPLFDGDLAYSIHQLREMTSKITEDMTYVSSHFQQDLGSEMIANWMASENRVNAVGYPQRIQPFIMHVIEGLGEIGQRYTTLGPDTNF